MARRGAELPRLRCPFVLTGLPGLLILAFLLLAILLEVLTGRLLVVEAAAVALARHTILLPYSRTKKMPPSGVAPPDEKTTTTSAVW